MEKQQTKKYINPAANACVIANPDLTQQTWLHCTHVLHNKLINHISHDIARATRL